ncbi:MAG: FAD-dependent oxidoreductase, partial [Ramlibacter sp.]
HPRIAWRGNAKVARIVRDPAGWRLLGETGDDLAQAPLVVVAAAYASAALLSQAPALQPVRGQVSWGMADAQARLPSFPMHGNGHLLPRVPMPGGDVWLCGATYARDDTSLAERTPDHADNLARLRKLAPRTARQLAPVFQAGAVRAWVQLRCVSSDRRPLLGEMAPGLWLSTAMGSRGLTFSMLCAELMAARLHREPLPLPRKLATALDARRGLQAK